MHLCIQYPGVLFDYGNLTHRGRYWLPCKHEFVLSEFLVIMFYCNTCRCTFTRSFMTSTLSCVLPATRVEYTINFWPSVASSSSWLYSCQTECTVCWSHLIFEDVYSSRQVTTSLQTYWFLLYVHEVSMKALLLSWKN